MAPGESALGAELGQLVSLLVREQSSTRAELARSTGLARSTISKRVDQLLRLGILVEVGDGHSATGRPPTLLAVNTAVGVVLAADLGATHARLALATLGGHPQEERSFEIDISEGPARVLSWLSDRFRELLAENGRTVRDVRAIGIGVPGPVEFATGTVVQPPIMPGWDGVVVPEVLSEHFDAPVLVDNDVNIMGLGEYWSRRLKKEKILFVKVATGIGCGIVTDGQVYRGADGAAGDIGHIQVAAEDDVICSCGNLNCLEAVASGSALVRQLAAQGLDVRHPRDVVSLSQAGDAKVVRLVRVASQRIGEVLASLVSFYNPSRIILGGALAVLRDDLLAGIRGVVYQRALPLATRRLTIETTAFGHRSGILGATILAAHGALSPDHIAGWSRPHLTDPAQ
jgi:predicted NBD/HSP70 family sugar kinase/biotin operon repressor